MGLNVYKFDSFQPFLPHRFACEINGFSLNVKDATIPTIGMDANEGRKRFGTTQFVLPTFTFAESNLEITFYEDDNMSVTSWLITNMQQTSVKGGSISIRLEMLDFTMTNVIWSRTYFCDLLEFDAPSFQRAAGASALEIKAKFIVRSWKENLSTSTTSFDTIIGNSPVSVQDFDTDLVGNKLDDTVSMSQLEEEQQAAEKADTKAAEAAEKAYAEAMKFKSDEEDRKAASATAAKDEKLKTLKEEEEKKKAEEEAAAAAAAAASASDGGSNPAGPQASFSGQGVVGTGKATGFEAFANGAYDKEMQREGKKAQLFFDLNDMGSQKGNINLGTGSAMKARDYTKAVGAMDVTIGGKQLHFNSDEALNDAIKKAFGADYTAIMQAYQNKQISYKEAVAKLKALGGRTITDSNGKTSTVQFTGSMGYINAEMSAKDVEEVKSVNMKIDTNFGDKVKSTFMANLSKEQAANNVVLKDFIHSVHAASGMANIIQKFGQDENNLKILADAIKQNKITKELSDAMYKTINQYGGKAKVALAGAVVRTMDKTATANRGSNWKDQARRNLARNA